MTYAQINGHRTWLHDGGGDGEPVLLLHGGLSNRDVMLDTIAPGLANYRVVAFDRRGHGYTADTDAGFHYSDMADETIHVLEDVVGSPAHLVGWSDGGIVALLVALERPDLVRKIAVIGTNYHYDAVPPVDAGLELDSDSDFRQMIAPAYIERSPDGADHLPEVVRKSFAMFASEPTLTTADLAGIGCPALIVAGDDDIVALAHTCSMYESIPHAQLAIMPGASHALPMEQPARLAELIATFLGETEPPATFMPVRRGARGPLASG